MKEVFRSLHDNSISSFNFWAFLYFNSNSNNEIEFTLNEVKESLKIKSNSSIYRFLRMQNNWNVENKVFTEIEKKTISKNGKISYKIKFFNSPKKAVKKIIEDEQLLLECKSFLVEFYKQHDFSYKDIKLDSIRSILNKIKDASNKDTLSGLDEEGIYKLKFESFKFVFNNIPTWWKEKKLIGLNSINKHWEKIINQIKIEHGKRGGNQQQGASIDFSSYTG